MNSKQIVSNLVDFYCDKEKKDKVILIDGKWGCGKTYAVKTFLSLLPYRNKKRKDINLDIDEINKYREEIKNAPHQKVKYVSLFGVKGIEDVAIKVYNVLGRKAKHRLKKIISVVPSTIASVSPFRRVNDTLEFVSNTLKEPINSDVKKIKSKSIIIFDDLERVDKEFSYISLLGYINTLLTSKVRIVCVCSSEMIKDKQSNYKEFCDFKEKTFDKIWDVTVSSSDITNEIVKETDITYSEFHNFDSLIGENLRIEIKTYDLFKRIVSTSETYGLDYKKYTTDYTLFYACLFSVLIVFSSVDSENKNSSQIDPLEGIEDENLKEEVKKDLDEIIPKFNFQKGLHPLSEDYEKNMENIFTEFDCQDGIDDNDFISLIRYIVNYYLSNDFSFIREFFDRTTIMKDGEDIVSLFYYSKEDNIRVSTQFLNDLRDGKRKLKLDDLFHFLAYTRVDVDRPTINLLKTKANENFSDIQYDYYNVSIKQHIKLLNEDMAKKFYEIFNSAHNQDSVKDFSSIESFMLEMRENDNYFQLLHYFSRDGMKDYFLYDDGKKIMEKNNYFYPDLSSTFTDYNIWQYCLEIAKAFHDNPNYRNFLDSTLQKHPYDEVTQSRIETLKNAID